MREMTKNRNGRVMDETQRRREELLSLQRSLISSLSLVRQELGLPPIIVPKRGEQWQKRR